MRAVWSGSVNFGLINFPVKLQSAVKQEELDFDLLSKKDLAPVRYAKIDTQTGEELSFKDIVKGYEYAKGKYVVITEEDFQRARPEKFKSIDILQFVKEEEIDPILYEKPYYLVPGKGGEKTYRLLVEALEKAQCVGIAEYMLRNRVHVCAIKPYNGVLLLNQMRYQDELVSMPEIKATQKEKITEKEIGLAVQLIEQLTETFNPAAFKDTYISEIKKVIKAKAAGKKLRIAEPAKPATPVKDLMEALKESLASSKRIA